LIKIESYTAEFEEIYWKTVQGKVSSNTQDYILNSSLKFMPGDFWNGATPTFKELILAPFEKLKKAQRYIVEDPQRLRIMEKECFLQTGGLNCHYQELVDAYKRTADSVSKGYSIRVRIVNNSGLTVCPYCNRDYINYREKNVSGAQLDHFFSKLDYPLFAVCLYNLVPVCGNCNRVKSNQTMEFASPFDETIDWEKDLTFHYESDVNNMPKIVIKSKHVAIQNNIRNMRIEEAYQIHTSEVEELFEKKRIYSQTQQQEFQEVLYKINLSEQEIKLAVFGPKITRDMVRKKPLGKMMSDLHKKLEIY
jgi:hypothetical protein